MSVIIRLQNLPWSANALDIRNYFRGLSIPEGGVHIVGGELGDAFIAFSTDEDARQAMMLDGGKIKEIQVKLLLSSRSEMHKVIEAARQSVPILTLTAPAPAPAPASVSVPVSAPAPSPAVIPAPIIPQPAPTPAVINPFSAALSNSLSSFGIPGIGNPQEIPQPAVIEPPAPLISPPVITTDDTMEKEDEKSERRRSKERERRRSRSSSRSRDRDRRDRKRDRRDRSRSRERRRRDRSRSKERRDRKRDRNQRSRSRERSPSRKSRDRRTIDRKSPQNEKPFEQSDDQISAPPPPNFGNKMPLLLQPPNMMPNGPMVHVMPNTFNDPTISDAYNKLQELGKKRNPNAFQGDQQNGGRMQSGRGGGNMARGGANFRMGGRPSRFDNDNRDCCVAIRNAPNHTSYGDVRRFFPFMIDKHGIKMINDNLGRRTGNIFVRFCDPRSKHLALQRKNNELKGAQVIVEALDDDAYESAVDSFLPYREDNDEEETILAIPEPEENTSSFSILKLSDLPNFVKEHDIIKAFSDFSLLSMMLNDDRQTRTRIAFVQFAKAEDAKAAYERKDKYLFGRRQATITPCTEEDYEKEKILQNEKLSGGDPRTVPRNEIRKEVIEEPAPEMEPIVPRDPRQRRPQFENSPGQQPATVPAIPPGPNFFGTFAQGGQQFPTPFPNPQFAGFPGGMDPRTAAANWANRPNFPNQMVPNQLGSNPTLSNQIGQTINQPINDLDDEPLDCVLMKGLPREATDRTIVTFLSDTGAVPARIHLMLDQTGMPSGDCFCEFRSVQEARLATTKHGHNLEGCRVTVDLVNRSVVEDALEGPKQPEMQDAILGAPPGPPQQYFENSRGGFPGRGFRGRGSFDRGGFDRGGFDRGFNPSRGGYDHNRGNSYRGRGFGDRGDRGGRGIDRGRGRGFGRGRGGYENGAPREEPDSTLEDFGAPGCVVSMENVPFRATVDEILSFFSDFDLTQDDIIRRYNERGQPTGDARVAFRTPYDAQRACKTRHMDSIHDRRITLSIL